MLRKAVLVALMTIFATVVTGDGSNTGQNVPENESLVYKLTDETFDKVVKESKAPWLVDFQNQAPSASEMISRNNELRELAYVLAGSGIQIGAVDQTSELTCGAGKPGLRFYGADKSQPKVLAGSKGSLYISDLALGVLDEIKQGVLSKLSSQGSSSNGDNRQNHQKSKSSSTSSSSSSSSSKRNHGGKSKSRASQSSGKVLELTEQSFDDIVQNSEEAFLISFTAPWCGHCQRLQPEWRQAARDLADTGVVIANVDATANEGLAQRFGIQGFPTIKFFPPGLSSKTDESAEDYQYERSAEAIVSWSLAQFERHGGYVQVDIPELTSQADFEEHCASQEKCVIAFLPHILDSGKDGREQFIMELEGAQRNARHLHFTWVEAGAQAAWEEAYSLEFGFPAVLLLRRHDSRELALPMRGSSFNSVSLAAFASSARTLGEFFDGGWPRVQTVEAWDGEEGKLPEVEDDDFDLDDFLADD
mmetsp:Transcript_15727/g.30388  ORF Transcript_15727/g.30388 Transcript_15727/m.30388 type:complete len:476 (+) Transcript_15727:164-1591(+)